MLGIYYLLTLELCFFVFFVISHEFGRRMTDLVGLCCALNYNKELTVDSCTVKYLDLNANYVVTIVCEYPKYLSLKKKI